MLHTYSNEVIVFYEYSDSAHSHTQQNDIKWGGPVIMPIDKVQ